MTYRVELGPRAREEVRRIGKLSGSDWFVDFECALASLREMPERCAVDSVLSSKNRVVRQLIHGRGHHVYRVYFSIESRLVKVLHVRHAARRPLKRL